jgi:8-oxo-dGTP diphosphatase
VTVEHQHSAGGVVVRDGTQVLLISTRRGRRWRLPKGQLETGESPQEAALREVREETGVVGRLRARLPDVEYRFNREGRRIHKRVDYFLLEYVGGDIANFDASEVSGAAWFSWETSLARLSFDNEREVVRHARDLARANQDEERS